MQLRYFLYQVRVNKSNGASLHQLKHFLKWNRSLEPQASSISDEQPWITYDAISFLNTVVNKQSIVFEYGGGGSTLFFVNRVKEVVTVEHDKEWFKKLSEIIKNKRTVNWNGNHIEPQKGDLVSNPANNNPENYSSGDKQSKGLNFLNYVSFIDRYPDGYFDTVLVDGRSRPACIKHAIPKLKTGGYLVLDNSDRNYYLTFFESILDNYFTAVLEKSGPSPYSKQFTKTSIWRKK